MDPARADRLRKLLADCIPFPERGRGLFVDTGLDFPARGAAAALGAGRVLVVERDLAAARALRRALPDLDIRHAARAEPSAGDLVVLPAGKQRLALFLELERLAAGAGPSGRIALYGARREGILPAQALLARHCDLEPPVVRGGARLLLARPRPATDWGLERPPAHYTAEARGVHVRVAARPGLFSWNALDPATALLLEACVPRAGDRLLDLGCGAGVAAAVLLVEGRVREAVLADSDALALEASRETLAINGLAAEILASDAGEDLAAGTFDLVLCNPPLHHGFAAERRTPARMAAAARDLLAPRGRLVMVTPPTLGARRLLMASFGNAERVAAAPGMEVWRAERPGKAVSR
ncbi:MAG: methyltransferase [Candidatus Krumholzibacteriota bacterium]|nr:methyltransferase [Candidatus Krumholzibacteriota bacterium]